MVPGEGFEAGANGVQGLFGGLLAVVEGHQRAGGVVQHALQLLQVAGVASLANRNVDQELAVSGGQVASDQRQAAGVLQRQDQAQRQAAVADPLIERTVVVLAQVITGQTFDSSVVALHGQLRAAVQCVGWRARHPVFPISALHWMGLLWAV